MSGNSITDLLGIEKVSNGCLAILGELPKKALLKGWLGAKIKQLDVRVRSLFVEYLARSEAASTFLRVDIADDIDILMRK